MGASFVFWRGPGWPQPGDCDDWRVSGSETFPREGRVTPQLTVAAGFRRRLASSSPRDMAPCFLRRLLLPSRQGFLLLRTLGNDHAALPGRLVRKPQLPSYLVCSDKEQNLTELRREPQLAKPRDFHPSHTPPGVQFPLTFL